ncbi:MAG: TonB-dependent receptor [Methylococcaceae bacterium]|nr:TonB-dependent receptor [Methylococcaceae bacterium]
MRKTQQISKSVENTGSFKLSRMASLLLAGSVSLVAMADGKPQNFNIPALPLDSALTQLADKAGLRLLYSAELAGKLLSRPVSGQFTPEQALKILLSGSGLSFRKTADDAFTVEESVNAAEPQSKTLPTVTVVGKAEDDSNDSYNPDYHRTNASTATKTDTPIMETPVSIQVVPQAVLKDQQAYRLQDAVKNVSGVQQRFSSGGQDRFVVRGFDLEQLHYRNGIRVPNTNVDIANVNRIEVVKGPASGLYGRIEPGGLINVVTKRPSTEPYYSVEQRFGSYDYYRTEANATGPITKDGSLAYRFDLSSLNSNSFREFGSDNRVFVAPSLTWKPREDTEFNLTFEYLNEDRAYDSGIPVIGNRIASVPITRSFEQNGLTDNHDSWLIDFNWTHSFNENWKLRNGVVATETRFDYKEIYLDDSVDVTNNGDTRRFSWFGDPDTNNYNQQTVYLDVTGKFETFGIRHTALVGGDYYFYRANDSATAGFIDDINIFKPINRTIDQNAVASAPRLFNFIEQNSWYGVYFQDEMTFWDKLHIMGGGRYDIASYGTGYSDVSLTEANAGFDDLEENQFSPRVGILYQPWQELSLYGHFVESFGANNGRSESGQPFKPQTSTEFEGGIKTELFDGRLSASLAYYDLTKQNTLTPDPNNSRLSVAIGEARSRGVEFDMKGQLSDALNMIATYAYADTKITKDNSGNQGNRLPYAPLHSGSLWLKYDFQPEFLKGFSLGAGVYAADKRYGDAANSFFDDAYARLDLMAAYRFNVGPSKLTTQLNINNVTDTEYFTLRNRAYNLPAEPLTVLGSIRLEY